MTPTDPRHERTRRRSPANPRESANEALERALEHLSIALSEGIAGARAILDAASIVVSGRPADAQPNLAELARTLDQIAAALSGESPSLRATALNKLLDAIDSEVARWEMRSRSDDDARAVLRVFMGMREVLWELGLRREAPQSRNTSATRRQKTASAPPDPANVRKPGTTPRPRVQRITIQG